MSRKAARLIATMITPLVALTLAACSGEGATGAQSAEVEEAPQASYVDVADPQGSLEDYVGAIEDVEITLCESTGQALKAEGKVTNPTDGTQSYRLYVAFNKGRDTKGLKQVDVTEVTAGETSKWEAEVPVNADGIECAVRVERYNP